MGLNLFKHVDVLNVHDYEAKREVKGQVLAPGAKPVMEFVYSAYYEYFVAPEAHPKSAAFLKTVLSGTAVPRVPEGSFWWVAKIHDRGDGGVLACHVSTEKAHDAARGAAQKWLKKEMEKHRRPK